MLRSCGCRISQYNHLFVNIVRDASVSAGCLVIGNEILNGSVRDANIQPLGKLLHDRGVQLKTVRIIGDDKNVIHDSIKSMNKEVDYIFTTGGIGPTHDDITYEAIAHAYNTTLQLDKDTEYLLEKELKRRDTKLTDERRKMCIFPASAKVYRTKIASQYLLQKNSWNYESKEWLSLPMIKQKTSWVPLVVVENCFIFPGVPHIFLSMLDDFSSLLPENQMKMNRIDIFVQLPEGEIAKVLGDTEKYFSVNEFPLELGSYPELIGDETYQVRVSLQSMSLDVIKEAKKKLFFALPFRDMPFGEKV